MASTAAPTPTSAARTTNLSLSDVDLADQQIAQLEEQLRTARERRARLTGDSHSVIAATDSIATAAAPFSQSPFSQQQHFLLLLSDSALPLGSFAFSSGLESFLAHDKARARSSDSSGLRGADAFAAFLPLSVSSYAATSLPFVLAAHDAAVQFGREAAAEAEVNAHAESDSVPDTPPSAASAALVERLVVLDDTYDATIICTVGRRASVAQGRALLSVWERAFGPALASRTASGPDKMTAAAANDPLRPFSRLVKRGTGGAASSASTDYAATAASLPTASAHIPPLFGAVAALAALDRRQTADVFVLAHCKALASAAVRAGLMGPYQAQHLLASPLVQALVGEAVERAWKIPIEAAGQTAPVVDLWMGRHEMLYSRIFNS